MLHDVEIPALVGHVRNARWTWFAAAVLAATLTFPLRTIRWRYLLRIEGVTLPFGPLWHATAIGFMANNILPARAGEFARAYAARQLTGVRFSTAFASIAVERILDGLTMVAMLVVATLAADFDAGATVGGVTVERLALVAGLAFGGLFLAALAVVRWPALMLGIARSVASRLLSARWADRMTAVLEGIVMGLEALRTPGQIVILAFWSVVVWTVGAASFYLAFLAFGIDVPWTAALLLQSVIAFGVAIPSSPGFFGVFEAAARASLVLYGVAPDVAVSLAIGFHIGGFVPITVLGLYSLGRAGLRLAQLRGGERTGGTSVDEGEWG